MAYLFVRLLLGRKATAVDPVVDGWVFWEGERPRKQKTGKKEQEERIAGKMS